MNYENLIREARARAVELRRAAMMPSQHGQRESLEDEAGWFANLADALEERLRVNVGLLAENKQLREKLGRAGHGGDE